MFPVSSIKTLGHIQTSKPRRRFKRSTSFQQFVPDQPHDHVQSTGVHRYPHRKEGVARVAVLQQPPHHTQVASQHGFSHEVLRAATQQLPGVLADHEPLAVFLHELHDVLHWRFRLPSPHSCCNTSGDSFLQELLQVRRKESPAPAGCAPCWAGTTAATAAAGGLPLAC